MHTSGLEYLLVLAIAGAVAAGMLKDLSGSGVPNVRARRPMTDRETAFWPLLRVAAAPLHVAPQMAMGALLRATGGDGARGVRNRFDRKIVDFVLLDDGGGVRLLIELDDRLHRVERDAARDRMTARAGYRTLRIQGATARDLHLLKAAIDDALGIAPSWSPPVFNPAAAPRRARNMSAPPNTPRA